MCPKKEANLFFPESFSLASVIHVLTVLDRFIFSTPNHPLTVLVAFVFRLGFLDPPFRQKEKKKTVTPSPTPQEHGIDFFRTNVNIVPLTVSPRDVLPNLLFLLLAASRLKCLVTVYCGESLLYMAWSRTNILYIARCLDLGNELLA